MMHIVHSVFNENYNQNQSKVLPGQQRDEAYNLRLQAHQQVCAKYHDEIIAIRKYLPGWKPLFNDRMSE